MVDGEVVCVEANGLLPLPDAMALISKAGFAFGQDRWELWVRTGLMPPAQRIPGSNQYGVAQNQWRRLQRLIAIDGAILGRHSPSAIAYYAACRGLEVPGELVGDHLIKGVTTFYSIMRRRMMQQSNGRLDPRMLSAKDARTLAKKLAADAQHIIPIRNPVQRAFYKQFLEEFSYVVVCVIFNIRTTPSLTSAIRGVANAIFTAGTSVVAGTIMRRILERDRDMFVDPTIGDNKILREIRDTQSRRPELLVTACRDTGLAFMASVRGFGLQEQLQHAPSADDTKGVARENARGIYAMFPFATGLCLAMNLHHPDDPFLTSLRQTQGAALEKTAKTWDRFSERYRKKVDNEL